MQKIMFNDKCFLTDLTLEGIKTQTRRIINLKDHDKEYLETAFDWDFREMVIIDDYARYKLGEIVAVAQSYKDADNWALIKDCKEFEGKDARLLPGWKNKMFVKSEYMPHKIRITNIRIQKLQDISDEDCLAEGIQFDGKAQSYYCGFNASTGSKIWLGRNPREAFAALIDRTSGKGTWQSNPFVFVYEYTLIK